MDLDDALETGEPAGTTATQPGVLDRARQPLLFLLCFAACAVVLGYIQSATAGIIDPDGYYHLRWSRILWENLPYGRLPEFVWLPLTTLNPSDYVDHHFLFHILQIPFTWASDMVWSAKLSAVLYGSLAIASVYALILWYRVRYPILWIAVLIAASDPFLFRMSLPRAPAATIVTLALASWLLFTGRTLALAVLSFLLVWMYSLFPLVGVMAACWAAGVLLEERRLEWKPVVYVGAALVLGMIVNPYFPENINLFLDHVGMKVTSEYEVSVGNEWYPYESWYLLVSSAVAFGAQIIGTAFMQWERREGLAHRVYFLLFSTFLMVLTFKSRRFVEYWPPFAVLLAAFALKPVLERYTWDSLGEGWPRRFAMAGAFALAVLLGISGVKAAKGAYDASSGESDPNVYRDAAYYLRDNTPAGSIVFNTDWDDFPMLFFHNPHNVYVAGLDPTYLLHADPDMWKLYEEITLGRKSDPGPIIKERFGCDYAFTDSGHKDFISKATENGGMEIVYEDEHAVVLRVVEGLPAT